MFFKDKHFTVKPLQRLNNNKKENHFPHLPLYQPATYTEVPHIPVIRKLQPTRLFITPAPAPHNNSFHTPDAWVQVPFQRA